jgi:hypothetical protein
MAKKIVKHNKRSTKKHSKKSRHSKRNTKRNTKRHTRNRKHTGGAIYTFDLNDKIGGQSARIPLNGTRDGDCPATGSADLGFVNYGQTRGGGSKKSLKYPKSH